MLEYLRRRSAPSSNLLDIIAEVRTRWRFKLLMRGAVWVAGIGLLLLLTTASGLEWASFRPAAIVAGRVALAIALIASVAWFLVRPMRRRVTDEQVALYLEEHEPSLQATLVSAVEASRAGNPESAALVRRVVEPTFKPRCRCACRTTCRCPTRHSRCATSSTSW